MKKFIIFLSLVFLIGCASASKYQALQYNDNPEQHQRVIRVMKEVVMATNPENLEKYRFRIYNAPFPDAQALCQDYLIYVSIGALNIFTDDELSYAFAHEVGHVQLGHCQKIRGTSAAITSVAVISNFFLPGIGLLNRLVNPMVTARFSKEHEMEADQYAILYLHKNTSPKHFISMFQKILDYKKSLGEKDTDTLFGSHPSIQKRIDKIIESGK